MTDMTSWLASLDQERLEHVLSHRPDATTGSIPRNLDELAQRLGHPRSVAAVLDAAPAPLRQVVEALLALGTTRTEAALRDLLERQESDHDAAVTFTLERLYDCAIAWPDEDGGIGLAAGVSQVFPRPLGLGPPLQSLVEQMSVRSLRQALHHLDEPQPPARRDEAAAALRRRLGDPAAVRAIVAAAPDSIARHLHVLAGGAVTGPNASLATGVGDDDGLDRLDGPDWLEDDAFSADFRSHRFHYGRYDQSFAAESWAVERGLLSAIAFGAQSAMPAEIAMALRGTAYRAPFTPYPPSVPATAIDPVTVESGAAAAATDFAGQAVAVLDLIARAPLAQLKSGGVGARELARVAKTAVIDEAAARLAIELAAELGLVAMDGSPDGGFLRTTQTYPSWRELEPAASYAILLDAWLDLEFTPTASTDPDGRATRLLQRRATSDDDADAAREVLLTVLASLPPGRGTTRAEVAPSLLWARPRVGLIPQDTSAPYATVWAEAERLGVIAAGALSRIGRALDDRDGDALADALRTMLPASTDSARFGSDLTVLVAGSPSVRVSSLLDAAADRESRGAGVTWRFSAASVRRALDDGADLYDLLAALEAIAVGELPQPLRYLVNDVARRHGELRVAPARTVIRGDDTALLAQVAADRTLRGLGLRLAAPTVLTSAKSEAETLLALRTAGYLPVPEPREPTVEPAPGAAGARTPPPPRRATAVRPASTPTVGDRGGPPRDVHVSPRALAAHLLATQTDPARPTGPTGATGAVAIGAIGAIGAAARVEVAGPTTEQVLARLNPMLAADEMHQLAYAVETGGPVSITYQSTSGAHTRRVISNAKLGGGMLDAWCYLRDDERYFLVDRILSVAPGSP